MHAEEGSLGKRVKSSTFHHHMLYAFIFYNILLTLWRTIKYWVLSIEYHPAYERSTAGHRPSLTIRGLGLYFSRHPYWG